MKLTVLTDNAAGGHCLAEHGLSYFIESDKRLLFDTGSTDIFLKNAKILNIDVTQADMVALSHGHWDHGNGLAQLDGKKLVCHPGVFMKRYRRNGDANIGLTITRDELQWKYRITETREPLNLSDAIIFLGEIPRLNSFESQATAFVDEEGNDDFVPDDSGLAVITDGGLVVVSGCAHSGICNIIEHTKKTVGIKNIKAVIGGFHLKENDAQTKETIAYLKRQGIRQVLPSHCTELPALAAFYNTFGMKQVQTGMVFEF